MIFKLGMLECVPQLLIAVFTCRIEVVAHRALDDGCVLRDDGKIGADIPKAEAGSVDFVDGDVA